MLSNNPHVRFWLDKFNFEDRGLARDFLDEFKYIPTNKFVSEIECLLIELIEENKKVSILPVRELLNKDECYYPQERDIKFYLGYKEAKIDSKSLQSLKKKSKNYVPTRDEIESFNPIILNPSSLPGSESIIANIITQLSRRYRGKVVTGGRDENPSITDLRRSKCHNLILVDDVIGSGHRMIDFIRSICRNVTINSWISGGILKVTVVSYMKSDLSDKYFRKIKQKFKCITVNAYPTFYELEHDKVQAYDKLLHKYCHKKEKYPLGYEETFGRAIFEHSVPNNTPAILWRDVKNWKPVGGGIKYTGEWKALFPGRSVPDIMKYTAGERLVGNHTNRAKIKAVLTVLRDNADINTPRRLAKALAWDTAVSKDIIAKLQINELLDTKLHITAAGLNELDYLESEEKYIEFNVNNYYPL